MTAMTLVLDAIGLVVVTIVVGIILAGVVLVLVLMRATRTLADRARREYRQRTELSTSWVGEKEGGLT